MNKTKILVPLEHFETSNPALDFLLQYADRADFEVTFFNTLDFTSIPGDFLHAGDYVDTFYERIIKAQRKQLEDFLQNISLGKITVKGEIVASPKHGTAAEVCRFATAQNFDLVLLFSKHRRGVDQIFESSHLLKIIRNCQVPMLVLSQGKIPAMHRIAYATDFSDLSADIFDKIQQVSNVFSAGLHLYKVNSLDQFQDSRRFIQERNHFIEKIGPANLPPIVQYNAWTLGQGIIQGAEDSASDVIAIATHARKGLSKIFSGSITERIIKDTEMPILVLNLAKEEA